MIVNNLNLEGLVKTNLVKVSIELSLDNIDHNDIMSSVEKCKETLLQDNPEIIGMDTRSPEFNSKIHKVIYKVMRSKGFTCNKDKIKKSLEYLSRCTDKYIILCDPITEMLTSQYPEYYEFNFLEILEGANIPNPEEKVADILNKNSLGFSTEQECVRVLSEIVNLGFSYGGLVYKHENGVNTYRRCVVKWR